MTHTILVGAQWVVRGEQAEGTPEGMYSSECLACPAASGWVDNEVTKVGVWAIQHTASHGHRHYVTTTQNHWRVDPRFPRVDVRAQAEAETTTRSSDRGHLPRALRRVVVHTSRFAGPLVITALITVSALCGYLLGTTTS